MNDIRSRLQGALEDRYRIERELGEGGMATVYLARDLKHDREVALKVLKPELAAVVGADRFLAEIKTTANLQHPHILPLFDSGQADGLLYYVMPYVQGESLRDRLDGEHQLPVDDALRIAKNLAEALDYAHRQGVIHRDIKPANVLLQDGKPLIADFGIALAVDVAGGGRLTETGLSLGTPRYMSPEQATGEEGVDAKTDIYALACVLYEMLVGEPPYTGTTAQAVLGKILMGDVVPPTRLRRQVPPHVEAVTLRGLERLPADRFRSAREFAARLNDTGFTFDPMGASGSPTDRRVRAGSGWIRSLASVLVGGLVGVGLWNLLGPTATSDGQLAFYEINLPAGQPLLEFAVSPDGRSIVYRMGDGAVYRRRLGGLDDERLPSAEDAENLAISPDGEWLAFAVRDGGGSLIIQKIRLSGGPAITLAEHPFVRGIAWASPDELMVGAHRFGLRSVPSTGGELQTLTATEDGRPHRYPQALPDGRGVLFHIGGSWVADDIAVLPSGQSEWRVLTTGTFPQYVESGHILFQREGSLWAAAFDLERLELTSEPIPVRNDLGTRRAIDVSSDGVLYYAGARAVQNDTVVWVDAMGAEDPVGLEAGNYEAPELSPDGRRLLVRRGLDVPKIWVYDLQRGFGEPLTGEFVPEWDALWSPDGNDIVFMSRRTGPFGLYRAVASGTGDIEPLGFDGTPYDWTPDGGLLFSPPGTNDLIVRDLATGVESTLLRVGRFPRQGTARISPDGRLLVYEVTDATEQAALEVRPFPDVGRGRWRIETTGATGPEWAPDGSAIYFRAGMSIMRVPVDPEATSPLGSPESLFQGPYTDFDVGPDGRLLMIRPTGEEVEHRERIIVAVDWLDELGRLVAR